MVRPVQGDSNSLYWPGGAAPGGLVSAEDIAQFQALLPKQQSPASPGVKLAQAAVSATGFPFAPPVTQEFIPGTPENKRLTQPLARAIAPYIADGQTVRNRVYHLGCELGNGQIGAAAGHLFLGRPFPEHVDNPGNAPDANGCRPIAESFPADRLHTPPLVTPIPEQQKPEAVGGGFTPSVVKQPQEGYQVQPAPVDTTAVHAKSKPDGMPTGTLPLDKAKKKFGLSKDDVHTIKDGIDARPTDWVGLDPQGNVWTGDENNRGENHGPYKNFLP